MSSRGNITDMTTGEKQEKFSSMIATLLAYLHDNGYSMRGGHWQRCANCKIGAGNSCHKEKLAFDINLSLAPSHDERPRYLTGLAAEKGHTILHDFWDSIGGAERIKNDLNHYSFEHRGVR